MEEVGAILSSGNISEVDTDCMTQKDWGLSLHLPYQGEQRLREVQEGQKVTTRNRGDFLLVTINQNLIPEKLQRGEAQPTNHSGSYMDHSAPGTDGC